MAKNIGATLKLNNGNFFANMKSAVSAAGQLKSSLSGATNGVKGFRTSVSKVDGVLSGAVKKVAAVTAACVGLHSAIDFGKDIIQIGSEYQDSVAKVSTIADTTVKSISDLSDEIIDLSNTTGVAAADLNESLYQAISAGADTATATELVAVAVKAAKGGFTDTETAVNGLTSVLNTYGMATTEAQSLANQFLITQNKGKTSFGELASTIGQVAPVAKSTGVGISELLSGVASLTANGLSTSSAMTGMKAALSNIIKPTADAQKTAAELGLDFSTTALQAQGLSGFMKTLAEKTGGNTDTMAKLFGSVEGLNAMITLTSEGGMKLMNDTMAEMQTNTTALEDAYGAMTNTVSGQVEILKNKLKNMKINIFEKLDGSKFVDVVKMISSGIDQLTPTVENITVAIGNKLFDAINVAIPPIVTALTAAGNAISFVANNWKVLAAVALPVITPIVTGIGLYKGAVAACNIYDNIRNGLIKANTILLGVNKGSLKNLTVSQLAHNIANKNSITQIRLQASLMLAAGKAHLVSQINCMKNTASIIAHKAATVTVSAATKAAAAAQWLLNAAFVATPIGWIVLGIAALVTAFVVLWKKCEGFRNFWKGLWNAIKTAAIEGFEIIKTVVTNKIEDIKTAAKSIKDVFSNAFNSVKDTISNTWDRIKSLIKVPHIEVVGHVSIAGMDTPIPKLGLKWYAKGGIMTRPTVFGINGNNMLAGGEAGHEAILPIDILWDKLGRFADNIVSGKPQPAPATNNIYITVPAVNGDETELANRIAKKLVEVLDNM